MTYTTIDDLVGALSTAIADETSNLFQQGDILVEGVNDLQMAAKTAGERFSLSGLFRDIEAQLGYGRRTFFNRYRTSAVFPDAKRVTDGDVSWSHYCYAAQAASVTKPETYHRADEWLDRAMKDGLTATALKDVMTAAKKDVNKADPVYLLKRVECTLIPREKLVFTDDYEVSVYIPADQLPDAWPEQHIKVLVTMMIPPSNEISVQAVARESAA